MEWNIEFTIKYGLYPLKLLFFSNFAIMKKGFHKTISVLMALVVLFATMSFTVDMHYCGDSLVDFSLYHKAESCGMEKIPVSHDGEPAFSKKSCCSDLQIIKEASQNLKTSFDKLTFGQQTFLTQFFYTFVTLFEELDSSIVPFKDYHPPFLEQDVLVLNQVFLI